MNNLPFTELPAPKRTHRLAIVAVWNPRVPLAMECEHAGCKQIAIEEISECPVCGRWMCPTCFGYQPVMVTIDRPEIGSLVCAFPCCDDCGNLTRDERQAVMGLRAKLGGAM